MSLTRTLAHNTIIQFSGKIISTLLGLIAFAIMARYLGVARFGWFGTAVGYLQFVGILCDFGFTVTISNLLSEPTFAKRAVLNTVFTWRLITALAIHGVAPFIFLFFPYSAELKYAVFILSASFLAVALNNIFIGYYRAELKMWVATVGEVLGRVLLIAGVALVALTNGGFLNMMWVITGAAIIPTLYLFFKIGGITLALDRAISHNLFHKMWPTAVAVIFNAVYLQGDRVILPLYTTQTDVGLYAASYRVLDVVLQISAMSMGLVMPLITYAWSRKNIAEFSARYQLALDLLALLLMPITVGIFILSDPLMRLVAGAEFSDAAYMLRWLSISIVGTCFGMAFGHVALAINRQKQTLWVYVSDAILSLIGYFIFIPLYGVRGAIGVTIFSEWYAGFALMVITIYYAGFAPRFFTLAKIMFASLIMGAVVMKVPTPHLVWSILLGMVVFAIFTLLLKIISLRTLREVFSRPAIAENAPF